MIGMVMCRESVCMFVARCVGGGSGTVDGGPLVKYLYRYVGLWRPDAGAAGVFK